MFNFDKFEKLSIQKGLSRSFVTRQLGKSTSFFADYRKGKFSISENDARTIANLLGTNVDYLMDRSEDDGISKRVYIDDLDEDTKEVLKMCMEHKGLAKKLLDLAEALSK